MSAPPRARKSRPGKEWEHQVGQALRHAGCQHNTNSNDEKPVCDWRAVVPTQNGRSLLVECKETEKDRISFSAITPNEGQYLDRHHVAGGLTLVLVSRVFPGSRQAWACTWREWVHLEDTLGSPSRSPKVRRAGHVRLDPPPECFVPLAKVERPHGLGFVWDLRPILGLDPGSVTITMRPTRCDMHCAGCVECWPVQV